MCEACDKKTVILHTGAQRVKLREINPSLHCSIIGTCLSMRELRKIARKIAAQFDEGVTDYDVHSSFVNMVNTHDLTAKLLNKLLDRKYANCIRGLRPLRTEEELLNYWQEALQTGDIPGPYWAVMSHRSTTEHLRAVLFGDVHMLSHLVGASNRADIQRLQDLEAENEILLEEKQSMTKNDRNMIIERDREITRLRDEVTREKLARTRFKGIEHRLEQFESGTMVEGMSAQIQLFQKELERQSEARQRHDETQKQTRNELIALRKVNAGLVADVKESRAECDSLERVLEQGLGELCKGCDLGESDKSRSTLDLGGVTILYVGGRTSQIHHMKTLVEQAGGTLVHHDGGLEDNDHRLTQLLSRGDVVMCPIDCVSHNACLRAKKFCRNKGKDFVPLRSSGLSSFVAGLEDLPVS